MSRLNGIRMQRRTAMAVVGLILACFTGMLHAAGTELNCMVFTYGKWDYEVKNGASDCMRVVETAKQRCGGTRLAFVNTHFWVDENGDGVDYYCYRNNQENGCEPVTAAMVQAFSDGMAQCFAKAVSLGYDIEITPHIDDGLGKGGWRNALVFDPNANYGGMSYTDMMIKPIAEALKKAVQPDTNVYFATQGEMSATVMRYPMSWKALIPEIKQWVGGDSPASQERVKVGVSTNFNKLCACVLMDLVDPTEYLRKLPAALEPIIGEFDIPAITALYDEVDFIGISSYASMPANFTNEDLENAAQQFSDEAINFGINLTALTQQGKKLHYSEYGVGGGTCGAGNCPASTAAEAAKTPFFGIFGAYSKLTDPWQKPELKRWQRSFFKRTTQWLARNGGPTYRVDALYMWNLASWDAVGISTSSTSVSGSYYDPIISKTILDYNTAVAAAAAAEAVTPALAPTDPKPTLPKRNAALHTTTTAPRIVIPDAGPAAPITRSTIAKNIPLHTTTKTITPKPSPTDELVLIPSPRIEAIEVPSTQQNIPVSGLAVKEPGQLDSSGFVEQVNPIDMDSLLNPDGGTDDTSIDPDQPLSAVDAAAAEQAEQGQATPMDMDPVNPAEEALVADNTAEQEGGVYDNRAKKHRKDIGSPAMPVEDDGLDPVGRR